MQVSKTKMSAGTAKAALTAEIVLYITEAPKTTSFLLLEAASAGITDAIALRFDLSRMLCTKITPLQTHRPGLEIRTGSDCMAAFRQHPQTSQWVYCRCRLKIRYSAS